MRDSVTFLGTSDGLPSPDRYHASLLVRLAGQTILLDCGEPCSHVLKRMGVDFNSIDAVIITHTHSDHIGGLPMLLQSMWLEGRRRPLPIWLPPHARRVLPAWLRACYLFESLLGFRVRWGALRPGLSFRVGKLAATVHRTTHLDSFRKMFGRRHPQVRFDAFSVLLSGGGRRLAYSADLGAPEDLRPLLTRPLDLLITELAHFHPPALFQLLHGHAIRQVAVTHLGRPIKARLTQVRALARGMLPGKKVYFVADGDRVRFAKET